MKRQRSSSIGVANKELKNSFDSRAGIDDLLDEDSGESLHSCFSKNQAAPKRSEADTRRNMLEYNLNNEDVMQRNMKQFKKMIKGIEGLGDDPKKGKKDKKGKKEGNLKTKKTNLSGYAKNKPKTRLEQQHTLWMKKEDGSGSELSDDAEFQKIERNVGRSSYTIYPDNYYLNIWEGLIYLVVLFIAFRIPFFISFSMGEESHELFFNSV
jgi:hypothetical protein